MYTGRLIEGLLDMAERVRTTARVRQSQNMESAALGAAVERERGGADSESKELAKPLGLSPADRDLGLLLVVHSQLVRALEPGHDFPDTVDVHQVRAMGPPKKVRVETVQQLFQRPAVGLSLHSCCARSHDCDHAVFNPRVADVFLVHEKHAAGGLEQDL